MAISDCHGLPVVIGVRSPSPNGLTLVEDTLQRRHIEALPKCVIADRSYDSNRFDERLQQEHGSNWLRAIAAIAAYPKMGGHRGATSDVGNWSDC